MEYRAREHLITDRYGVQYAIQIALDIDLSRIHLPHWAYAADPPQSKYFPLMTRAWAYQERLLSSRLVHFTTTEIMWECADLLTCECLDPYPPDDDNIRNSCENKEQHRRSLVSGSSPDHEHWTNIVSTFTRLKLTFEKDKLPALSGVAAQTMRIRVPDTYLAGLWANRLLLDLCWSTLDAYTRPAAYRAPSWSWASLDGSIKPFMGDPLNPAKTQLHSTVVKAYTTLATSDPFGQVSFGSLTISGPVIKAHLEASDRHHNLVWNGHAEWYFEDCRTDISIGLLTSGDTLFCLRLATCREVDFCLVLRKTNDESDGSRYQRVGHVDMLTRSAEELWFPADLEHTVIEII